MKSVLFLLLFAFLLVAMPAVAADLVSVDAWLIPGVIETESEIRGNVTVESYGENLADLSVCPYQHDMEFIIDEIVLNDPALIELDAVTDFIYKSGTPGEVLFNTALG